MNLSNLTGKFWSFQKTATKRKQLFSYRHNKEDFGLVLKRPDAN